MNTFFEEQDFTRYTRKSPNRSNYRFQTRGRPSPQPSCQFKKRPSPNRSNLSRSPRLSCQDKRQCSGALPRTKRLVETKPSWTKYSPIFGSYMDERDKNKLLNQYYFNIDTESKKIDQNLLTKNANEPGHIIVVYADWCGHCQNLKKEVGSKFGQNSNKISFYEDTEIKSPAITGYPSIFIVTKKNNNQVEVVDGTIDNIKQALE